MVKYKDTKKSVITQHKHHTAGLILLLSLSAVALGLQLQSDAFVLFIRGLTVLHAVWLLLIALASSCIVLFHEWKGIANNFTIQEESLASVEKNHPYVPRAQQMILSMALTVLVVLLG